jgi:cytochrome c553
MRRRLRTCQRPVRVFSLLRTWAVVAGLVVASHVGAAAELEPAFSPQQIEFFESEIRPLFSTHCWKCHAAEKQQGGLRLDSRAAILTGGDLGPAATPADPDASRLVEVVEYAGDIKMPPSGKLSEREMAAIRRWVREGMAWPAIAEPNPETPNADTDTAKAARPIPWSFQPVVDPPLPEVKDAAWCDSPLDRFVLARLEADGLTPAAPADKRTLLRRAKFDLLGLPPTPQEMDAFLADDAPDAFARLIDRFLAAPEYGQRWGRHWLDVARYADSNGQDENLAYVNAFRYRDYVVDSFNKDKPYDEFVREQIAGDLLGSTDDRERFERLVATGFLTLGPKMLAEDDPVKMEMDIVDEQLDTLGGAFLGLTLGCARCHDHKFDPISTADYYALAGIFKSTQTMDNFKVVAKWHERSLASAAEIAAIAAHEASLAAKKAETAAHVAHANQELVAAARTRLADYLLAATELMEAPPLASLAQDATVRIAANLPPGTILREAESFDRGNVLIDTANYGAGIGIILNRDALPNFVEYELELPQSGAYQLELRYAAAESRSVQVFVAGQIRKSDAAAQVTGSWNPDTQRWVPEGIFRLPAGEVVLRLERSAGPFPHLDCIALIPRTVAASDPSPLAPEELARERGLIAGFLSQWVSYLTEERKNAESIWRPWFSYRKQADISPDRFRGNAAEVATRLSAPHKPESATNLAARYRTLIETADSLGKQSPPATLSTPDEALRSVLIDAKGPLRPLERAETYYSLANREQLTKLQEETAQLEKSAPPALPQAMAVEDGKATDLRIHIRGSHLTLGEPSPRGFPMAFSANGVTLPNDASGRLQLAQWITDARHPLTSRVMANRLWRWHFGAGILRSTDNFGNLGDRPSHPELLDWLAARFVDSGWSIKSLHRLVMLSSTYQMSTVYNAVAAESDPDNRLLWRMNRRRLEAEAVRDSLIFVAGQLDTSLGGTLLKSNPRDYVTSTASIDNTNYATQRRSLYLPVIRSALYDPFQAFDFAEPTTLKGDRESTTIASQALFMMNSEVMNEQSARLAARITAEHASDREARVRNLYILSLGRQPIEEEIARALRFVDRYSPATPGQDPIETAPAWQALCRVLLSSNEFLYVE